MQELAEHWLTLEEKGMAATGAAIAGYVTGGDLAIRLALRQGIPGRFIALSPFVPDPNETLQTQIQATTPADLRGVITIGRLDSRCYSGALELAERLLNAGAAIDLRQLKNFTQGYPPNFSEFMQESLVYIFKNP